MNTIFPLYQYEEATTLDLFETGHSVFSCGPWIPIIPGSQDGPDLDKQWEGEDDEDN